MEERYHATTQNWFYPDKSNVNKNNTVEAKLISPSTYMVLNDREVQHIPLVGFSNLVRRHLVRCLVRGMGSS